MLHSRAVLRRVSAMETRSLASLSAFHNPSVRRPAFVPDLIRRMTSRMNHGCA